MKKKKGFTLVELLVVITAIAVLATITVVALKPARIKTRNSRRKADMEQIYNAQEMYYDANAAYLTSATYPDNIADTNQKYMAKTPSDPSGSAYQSANYSGKGYGWIDNTSDAQRFCAWAKLEPAYSGATQYYVAASENGVFDTLTTKPTSLDSCTP